MFGSVLNGASRPPKNPPPRRCADAVNTARRIAMVTADAERALVTGEPYDSQDIRRSG
jgi:hypothetical protein